MWLLADGSFCGYATLVLLFLQPLFPGWHLPAVHHARLCDKVSAVRLGLLLAVGLLRSLNSCTRLGDTSLRVKSNALGLVPPQRNAVAVPVLKNIVSLEKLVVPLAPLLVLRVAEYNSQRRLTRFNRSF